MMNLTSDQQEQFKLFNACHTLMFSDLTPADLQSEAMRFYMKLAGY